MLDAAIAASALPHRSASLRILHQIIGVGVAVAVGVALRTAQSPVRAPANGVRPAFDSVRIALQVRATLRDGCDSLDAGLGALSGAASNDRRARFRDARRRYKRLETLLSYIGPPLVEALNSAEAQGIDEDPAAGFRVARGFQLLEAQLFGPAAGREWPAAAREIAAMRMAVQRFRPVIALVAPPPDQVAELARLELARVSTLGIAGFDAPLSGDAISESADAIEGAGGLLATLGPAADSARTALSDATGYLRAHPEFESFDRFTFVRSYTAPAFGALAALRRVIPRSSAPLRRVWPAHLANVYDVRGFDVMAFAPPDAPRPNAALVERGRRLFFDPSLSGTGTRSCASCHVPELGFTDGRRVASPLDSTGPRLVRHTPTLLNAALQPAQFADERRPTLEDQIGDVLANPSEMRATPDIARSREIRTALASYVRSLISANSRFDQAMRGDSSGLSDSERRGFNLFMGKAGCGTCHFAPLFSGTQPPEFTRSDVEVIGVPRDAATAGATVDADPGRGAIDRRAGMARAFKTPTVRNAAITGPYMHNGVFRTLPEVLDFYARGGGAAIGAAVPNQTLPARPLPLTPADRRDLLAFIAALTDTTGLTARPLPAGSFVSPRNH